MFFRIVLLFFASFVWTQAAPLAAIQNDVSALAEHHFLSIPDYWLANATPQGKCDGSKVATMLIEVAKIFAPSTKSSSEAIAVLVEHRVISSPDYWLKNAVPGAVCVGKNVAVVLSHCAGQLPIDPPKSVNASPLDATPIAQLKDSYDVIIAGAGTGGVGAAVQAARMGCSVLLLEETDWIGGQMNAAAVTSMDEGVTLVRERGLYRELCGLIAAHYQPLGINHVTAYWNGHVCVEPRVGRHLLHVILGDAKGRGVLDLALRTHVTKVEKSGEAVTGVQIDCLGVLRKISSKVLVDATEWGDIIPLTGARYRVGNCLSDAIDFTRHVQSNTWTAVVKQYSHSVPSELSMNEKPPGYTEKVHAAFERSLVPGEQRDTKSKPWNWATFIGYRAMPDSSRDDHAKEITRTHLNFNNDYPSTVAEIEDLVTRLASNRAMQLKTLQLLYFIQHTLGKTDWSVANDEGYDTPYRRAEVDAWLAERPDLASYRQVLYHFAIIPYTRESRRIVGLHTLTAHEIERKTSTPIQFKSTVVLGDYAVDLHGSLSKAYMELDLDHEADIPHTFGERGLGPFAIPFECFIPEKGDGFLPAEKNISQSRMANGATRLQPSTLLMGQAAGAIAAIAVQQKIQPRKVDPKAVQEALLNAGDTLCIDRVSARWGSEEWKASQFEKLKAGAETN